jgi:oleate hydratase
MYYSNGNYEAFARPLKPEGVDKKSAYIVGSGLAGLAAASFLIRDGQMKGSNIHIFEELGVPGGACDGIKDPRLGFVCRGGREMENHFECLWDLFRSIPSIETEGVTVLEEFYWLNKRDPSYSLMRVSHNRGEDAHTDCKFDINDKAALQILKLFMTPDEELYDKTMNEFFDDDFYNTNFWIYWQTMFAFEKWHSALEMKLYIYRFIHHIEGLPNLKALKFAKYNSYESLILPLVNYCKSHGVDIQYSTNITNILFDIKPGKKVAKKIEMVQKGQAKSINLTENDLVIVTNGCNTECSTLGDNDHAADFSVKDGEGAAWDLWRNIAKQDPAFGHPEKFCSDVKATNWMSGSVTTLDQRIPPYVEKIAKRDPFSGKVVTGGINTIKDSNWLMSFTFNRQPHFKSQPKDQLVGWIYGLYCIDVPGNYIKKPMKDCTGIEICEEWLYHIGVPIDQIHDMASKSAITIPCMMPYVTAFFMPRNAEDRPAVVPEGAVNFAFVGQFAQTFRDTVFTTEYSVRTAMEAVYTLLNVDRGVPEVFNSVYDIRVLLDSTSKLMDGRKPIEVLLPTLLGSIGTIKAKLETKADGNVVTKLLKKYNNI